MKRLTFDDTATCGLWIGFPAGVLADRTLFAHHTDWSMIVTAILFLVGVCIWQWRRS